MVQKGSSENHENPLIQSNENVSTKTKESSLLNRKLMLFFAYVLLTLCLGALETLGGSLYNQLERQLNTSAQTIAYMLSLKPIISGIAALITAWVLDKFVNSHYYICIMSIITSAIISLMPKMKELWQMYCAFAVIGYAIGTIMSTYPVLTLRLYPNNNRAWFGLLVIYGTSKTTTPILLEASIQIFDGSYGPVLYSVSVLFIILSVILSCMQTPRHISSKINSVEHISSSKLRHLQYLLYTLFIVLHFVYSAFQSGLVNFIQKFVTKALDRNVKIARYLISCYHFGQLFYRLVVALFFKELNPMKSVLLANGMLLVFGLLFCSFGNVSFIKDSDIWILYVVYVNVGIWASGIFPGLVKLCEAIKPVTGLISGLLIISFSLGDASMVMLTSHLIEIFGDKVVPFPIFVFILTSLILTFAAFCVNRKYCKIKDMLKATIQMSDDKLLDAKESMVGAPCG